MYVLCATVFSVNKDVCVTMTTTMILSKSGMQHECENVRPEGCVFRSKYSLRTSSACGVNDVRRLRFFDGSLPMKSVKFCMPFL